MAYERKELINFVAEVVDTARGAGHEADAAMADAAVALMDADEKRIATLEGHVRSLRSCLSVMAHPEEGWPLTAIADLYEASRDDLSDGEGDDALVDLEAQAHDQMRMEWGVESRPVYAEVLAERAKQDAQWGGPAHDDTHTTDDWMGEVVQQVKKAAKDVGEAEMCGASVPPIVRARLIKIAALAIAGVESIDRKAGGAQ
jgi:hypothetical protein